MKSEDIIISTDKSKLDVGLVHQFLTQSYWAEGRSLERVQKSIDNSTSYGIYLSTQQIGFARVLTDYVAFAYIMDVFILKEHRGNGYSKLLMQRILAHPDMQNVRKWFLGTRDAHELYMKFGFEKPPNEISWLHIPGKEW